MSKLCMGEPTFPIAMDALPAEMRRKPISTAPVTCDRDAYQISKETKMIDYEAVGARAWRTTVLDMYKSGRMPLALAERALAQDRAPSGAKSAVTRVAYDEQTFPHANRLKR